MMLCTNMAQLVNGTHTVAPAVTARVDVSHHFSTTCSVFVNPFVFSDT